MINNWPKKKLGEVAYINPSKSEVSNIALGTPVSFVSMASISEQSGAIVNFENKNIEEVKRGYTYFANDDVLFAKITPCMENGKIALAQNLTNNVGFGTTEVHVIRAGNEILPGWIYSIIGQQNFRDEAQKHMTGSAGQQRVPKEFLENVQIPVPPKQYQQKIVERLDAIRKAQELCDTQISKTEELFATLLFKEFYFNKNLELKSLEDVATITSSKRIHQSDYVASGIPFYRTKEIVELSQNKPISLNLFISNEQFNKIKKQFGIPRKGDILISAVGTIGISLVIPDNNEFYFKDGNLLWIKEFKEVEPTYLKHFLDYSFSSVSGLAAGGAYKALTIIKLKQFRIPLPSISKQKQTIEKLDAILGYKKLLLKQKTLFKELFDSVLYKSMNGEIDGEN